MGILAKKKVDWAPTTTAEKRAALLPTHELVDWADTSLYHIGRSISEYRKEPDPAMLAEARLGAETLVVLLQEIERRAT